MHPDFIASLVTCMCLLLAWAAYVVVEWLNNL
jgi:hypothetical protein